MNKVLVKLNPLGYVIESKDIDRILYPVTEDDRIDSEHVSYFFQKAHSVLSVSITQRYARACEVMDNIRVGSLEDQILEKLIETLASAKRCYSYGESLASIELCALHGEMLTNFLCIINKSILNNDDVIKKCHEKIRPVIKSSFKQKNFYDILFQTQKIQLLLAGNAIDANEFDSLTVVHENRKRYFHRWDQPYKDVTEEALTSLKEISKVAAKKLDLMNKENIKKIKKYMQIDEK